MWVSVTLVILGVSGMALSSLWRKKNPLEVQKDLDYHEDARDVKDLK
jgi:ABC-type arginine transport system ATPase subunit